jgi:predicted nuclease with RNAse H fold
MGKILIGVDVGGPAKGFHAVALQDRTITSKLRSRSADEVAAWVQSRGADVVAIDAPCRWRQPRGPSRTAERQMAGAGISSFSTPTEEKAAEHPFYTWMLAGMKLYAALRPTHPVYDGTPRTSQVCFETFPQAVACALAGEVVSAKEKNLVRRGLLRRWGLDPALLTSIDEVDAALCAIAADAFFRDRFHGYGDPAGGFIIVPSDRLP